MTVKELIDQLEEFDPTTEVEILEPYDHANWIDVSHVEWTAIHIGPFTRWAVRIS